MRGQVAGSDEDGAFTVPSLPPGTYDLIVDVPGHACFTSSFVRRRVPEVEAGTEGLALVVADPATARVTVRAVPPADTTLRTTGVTMAKIHRVPIGSAGAFALRAVPCGDLEAWFGERAALEAGRPDLATRVVVGPGENPPLVVGPFAVDPRHAPARKGV